MKAREIALFLDGDLIGDGDREIRSLAKIEEAREGDISFIANPKYEKQIESTGASALIIGTALDVTKYEKVPPALIRVPDPYGSFVVLLGRLNPAPEQLSPGIHPTAVIAPSARLGKDCGVGPYVVIGENVVIGDRCRIFAHSVIGNLVKIGDDCLIYSQVSIREECILGSRVIMQPGVVVGCDGFGFAPRKDGSYHKIPQRGIVVIEDDVELQANTCVDRATMGETRIKRGTKLDNMVQIAHNVIVGEDTVIAGQSGVAGSTKLGNRVMVGGNVGIAGHLEISNRVMIAGNSGVSRSLTKEGETYFGYPAKEVHRARRIEGALRQLPELLVTIQTLEAKVKALEEALKEALSKGTKD